MLRYNSRTRGLPSTGVIRDCKRCGERGKGKIKKEVSRGERASEGDNDEA